MKRILLKLDAHWRLFIALIVSLSVSVLTIGRLQFLVQAIAVWNVFAWSLTVLAWLRIILAGAKTSVQAAKLQDSARFVIFLFVVFAAVASLASVAFLMGVPRDWARKPLPNTFFSRLPPWSPLGSSSIQCSRCTTLMDIIRAQTRGRAFPVREVSNFPTKRSRIFSILPIFRL
ncbi:MAG: DUF1345 domain-containing protein [Verrucomicrobia bacterium]|nr:DUF1345 domain-containing protein [Verrucomicrobiota bacterium]